MLSFVLWGLFLFVSPSLLTVFDDIPLLRSFVARYGEWISPSAAIASFAVFMSKVNRWERCIVMKQKWDALFLEGNAVRARLCDAFQGRGADIDPAAEVQGLQALYQSIYDLHDHTNNDAYGLAVQELDQSWLPDDKVASIRDFGI